MYSLDSFFATLKFIIIVVKETESSVTQAGLKLATWLTLRINPLPPPPKN